MVLNNDSVCCALRWTLSLPSIQLINSHRAFKETEDLHGYPGTMSLSSPSTEWHIYSRQVACIRRLSWPRWLSWFRGHSQTQHKLALVYFPHCCSVNTLQFCLGQASPNTGHEAWTYPCGTFLVNLKINTGHFSQSIYYLQHSFIIRFNCSGE